MKAKCNRFIATLLTVALVAGMAPETALAAGSGIAEQEVSVQTAEDAAIQEEEAAPSSEEGEDETPVEDEDKTSEEEKDETSEEEKDKTSEEKQDETSEEEKGEIPDEGQEQTSEEGQEDTSDVDEDETAEEGEETPAEDETDSPEEEENTVLEDETVLTEDSEYPVDTSQGITISSLTSEPGSYSVDLSWVSDDYFYAGNYLYLVYTEGTDTKLFPGETSTKKDTISSTTNIDFVQLVDVQQEYSQVGDDDYGYDAYQYKGTFNGTNGLKPETTYSYRLVYYYNSTCYFLSAPASFTTKAGITKSSVSIKNVTLDEVGYGAAKVSYQIVNPDNETIVETCIPYGTDKTALGNKVDGKDGYYSASVKLTDASATLTPQVVVYTGNTPTETIIQGASVTAERKTMTGQNVTIDVSAGTGSISWTAALDTYYKCDSLYLTVYYKEENDSTYGSTSQPIYSGGSNEITLTGIKASTKYEYYIHISADYSDTVTLYEEDSADEPKEVTTKELKTNLDSEFKDAQFLSAVKEAAGVDSNTELTSADLETITVLNISLSKVTTPITDITGIEYLTNLTQIYIQSQDIGSIAPLASLTKLKYVSLEGNDIKELPDLSGISALTHLKLNNNLLPASELTADKLPSGIDAGTWISSAKAAQRGEKATAQYATQYYPNGTQHPFLMELSNVKGRTYTCEVALNGQAAKTGQKSFNGDSSYGIISISDMGCDAGTYTASIKVTDQFGKVWVTEERQLVFSDQMGQDTAYVNADAKYASIQFYVEGSISESDVASVILYDKNNNAVGTADDVWIYSRSYGDLYDEFTHGTYNTGIDSKVSQISATIYFAKYLDAGCYDVKVTMADGTVTKYEDLVQVTGDAVITDICQTSSGVGAYYDDQVDYVYLTVSAVNLDLSKVYPVIMSGENEISEFDSVMQQDGDDFLYKLKKLDKDNAWKDSGAYYSFTWKAADGYSYKDRTGKTSIYIKGNNIEVLFYHYNYKKSEFEVFFNSQIPDGTNVNVKIYKSSSSDQLEAEGTGTISSGRIGFKLTAPDGSSYTPPRDSYRSIKFTFTGAYEGTTVYRSGTIIWYNYSEASSSTGTWSQSNTVLYQRSGLKSLALDYAKGGYSTADSYTAKIVDSSSTTVGNETKLTATAKTLNKQSGVQLKGTWTSDSGLAAGVYTIRYYKNSSAIGSETLYVYDQDKLYEDNQYGYVSGTDYDVAIISEQLRGEYIHKYSKNVSAADALKVWNDNYKLQIFDRVGNKVTDWSIVSVTYNAYGLYVKLTGLSEKDLGYYFKITDTKGNNLTRLQDGQTYYSSTYNDANDEYGQYISINKSRLWFSEDSSNNIYSSLYIQGDDIKKVSISFYKPYDTKALKTITVSKPSSGYYYYFTASDLSGLSDKEVYRAVATVKDGTATVSDEEVGYFGVKGSSGSSYVSYTISQSTMELDLNTGEPQTLTISDGSKNVSAKSWASSDEAVATVSGGKVTPVGVGTATITATMSNGQTLSCVVTVKATITSIGMKTTSLTLKEGETEKLSVYYVPSAVSGTVTWTSSDEAVATVAEDGTVTAVGAGKATITATCAEATGTKEAKCTVTVQKEIKDTVVTVNALTAVIGIDKTLSEIELPEVPVDGITLTGSWVDGSISLASFSGAKKFLATYKDADNKVLPITKEVTVNCINASQVTVKANDTVLRAGGDTEGTLPTETTVTASLVNAEGTAVEIPAGYDVTVDWTSSQKDKVPVAKNGYTAKVTVADGAEKLTANITAKVTIKKGTASKTLTSQKCAIQVAAKEAKITPITFGTLSYGDKSYALTQDTRYEVISTDFSSAEKTWALTLAINTEAAKLTIKSSDTSVAAIGKIEKNSTNDGYTAAVTVKKDAGYVEFTATADDAVKTTESVALYIKKAAVELSTDTVTLNNKMQAAKTGESVYIYPSEGFTVQSVAFAEGEGKDSFTITKVGNTDEYLIGLSSQTAEKKTYKLTLKATLNDGTGKTTEIPSAFTVKVISTEPKVTVKQTGKVNLFYGVGAENGYGNGSLSITSTTDKIASVSWKNGAAADFTIGEIKDDTCVISLNKVTDTPTKKGTLLIEFENYESVEKAITISTENKAAKLVLSAKSATIYPEQGITAATVDVYMTTASGESIAFASEDVDVKFDKTDLYKPDVSNDGAITFTALDASKNTKAVTATISVNKYGTAVKGTYKISVNKKKPTLVLDKKSIVLNKNAQLGAKELDKISVSVKDNPDAKITKLSATTDKNDTLTVLSFNGDAENGKIAVQLNDTGDVKKATSYKCKAVATLQGGETISTAFTVKVVDIDATKTVKLSAKGSIDVLNRDTTSVVYTPKLSNITGEIKKAEVAGSAANLFTADLDEDTGKITVKAKSDAALVTKYNYSIKLKLTLDNGNTLTTDNVKLKVTQSKPTVTVSPKQAVLSNNTTQSAVAVDITAKNKVGSTVQTESIKLSNMTDVFEYADGVLTLKNRGAVAKGKTYTLKFEVRYVGSADNEKPATVTLKVKIK